MENKNCKLTEAPLIAVTMGDAAGIGPELCLRLLADPPAGTIPVVVGSYALLDRVARATGLALHAPILNALPAPALSEPAVLDLPDALDAAAVQAGCNQARCGAAAACYIERAVRGAQEGAFAAVVTAPISKKALHLAGVDFPGHTEMLAQLTGTASYAMLLYSPQIACAFVTSHRALSTVSAALKIERVVEVAELAWKTVVALSPLAADRSVCTTRPLCLVGLNPHAGEEGLFGDEEQRILLPALERLRSKGIPVDGPRPPDTVFTPRARAEYSCYICMYHDQGCIPFKMLAFDTGVNVTMGLPIIRTSPDHGTAFDLAWQGRARSDSFLAAYELAARLSGGLRLET